MGERRDRTPPVIALRIMLDGDGAFPDLAGKIGTDDVIHLGNDAPPIGVAVLEHGTASGRPSIMLRVDLPDGRTVLAETTWALFAGAAQAVAARYGWPG